MLVYQRVFSGFRDQQTSIKHPFNIYENQQSDSSWGAKNPFDSKVEDHFLTT